MRRLPRPTWPLLAVLFAVLGTATPAAADYRDIYKECERGELSTKFSAQDLKQASQKMSSYLRDYTNCSDAIHQAQTSSGRTKGDRTGSGPGGTTAGGGGTTGGTGATGGATGIPTTGAGSTAGSGPAAPGAPAGLSADEQYIARTAAVQQADAAGSMDAALAAAKVPTSQVDFSSSGSTLPTSLVVALAASALLAILAAAFALLPRVRRFRAD